MVQVVSRAMSDGIEATLRRADRGFGRHEGSGLSGADDVHEHPPWTRMIQLDEEDPLPPPEADAAIDNRDRFAGAQEEMLAVRVPVRALVLVHVDGAAREVVVLIVAAQRGELPKGAGEIAQQQRLVLVDLDGGGGVLGEDCYLPVADAGGGYQRGDAISYVDEFRGAGRLEFDNASRSAH